MNQRGVRQSFIRSQSSSTKEKLLQYSDMKAKKTPKMTWLYQTQYCTDMGPLAWSAECFLEIQGCVEYMFFGF